MRLNYQTDFALRLLMHLSALDGARMTIASIAKEQAISRTHLMKVANSLARSGFVEAMRGAGGGIRLAKPAANITVGAVVRAMENDFAIAECLAPNGGRCRMNTGCRLKQAFVAAGEAFLQTLDRVTLADLTKDNPALDFLRNQTAEQAS